MSAERLYLRDAYLREADARVVRSEGDRVFLDRTIFFAESGGQQADAGTLAWDGGACRVVDAQDDGGDVAHRVEGAAPPAGALVRMELDWPRRHGLMRNHTAAHVLGGVLFRRWGSRSDGNQLYPDRGRGDFLFEKWDPSMRAAIESAVNEVLAADHRVENRWIPRAEFEGAAGALLRTAEDLLDPGLAEIRLTDIVGFDAQADGGTHVRSLREVGRFRIVKVDNKGKGVRRLEWTLDPP